MSIETIAVLGAGNGGLAVAGDLALDGYKVNLYSRSDNRIFPVVAAKGIEIVGEGRHEGFASLNKVTTDIKEAISGAKLIVVVVPTGAHSFIAQECAPHLKEGQTVFLNPGHTGGALEFRKTLRDLGFTKKITVCESMSITHGSRTFGPGKVRVLRLLQLLFSALPATDTEEALSTLKSVFPNQLKPATSVLETGFNNINAVEHPPGTIMNTGWIEHTWGGFRFYNEGITPSVGRVLDAVDGERLEIMRKLGLNAIPFVKMFYDAKMTTLREGGSYDALQRSEPNRFIKSPDTIKHRYIDEDVACGLVPMSSIGRTYGVQTPVMNSVIQLCSVANQVDYQTTGRTVKKMGIAGMSIEELNDYVLTGKT